MLKLNRVTSVKKDLFGHEEVNTVHEWTIYEYEIEELSDYHIDIVEIALASMSFEVRTYIDEDLLELGLDVNMFIDIDNLLADNILVDFSERDARIVQKEEYYSLVGDTILQCLEELMDAPAPIDDMESVPLISVFDKVEENVKKVFTIYPKYDTMLIDKDKGE